MKIKLSSGTVIERGRNNKYYIGLQEGEGMWDGDIKKVCGELFNEIYRLQKENNKDDSQ